MMVKRRAEAGGGSGKTAPERVTLYRVQSIGSVLFEQVGGISPAQMSSSSDLVTLRSQGFDVENSTGNYRLIRTKIDHAQVQGGDLGQGSGTEGMMAAVTKALGIAQAEELHRVGIEPTTQ